MDKIAATTDDVVIYICENYDSCEEFENEIGEDFFEEVTGIEILYKETLDKIAATTDDVVIYICENYDSCEEFENEIGEFESVFSEKLRDILD